jgi:hypothetical protein
MLASMISMRRWHVRGDGTFRPFRGGIVREELDPTDYDTPFDVVRETLERESR